MGIFSALFGDVIPTRCPVTETDREWVDDSFLWFAKEFGTDVIKKSDTITPTPNFFPETYTATYEDVEKLVHRVCGWMKIDPGIVDLRFFADDDATTSMMPGTGPRTWKGAAGLYAAGDGDKEFILAIEENTIHEPVVVVSTIAHELSHAHLIGSGRVTREDEDQEYLTDLLTVYFGMGIFTANASFRFRQWEDGRYHGWEARKHGYLPEPVLGYALALYALGRGESRPPWARYLQYNVNALLKKSLKYLGECDLSHLSAIIEPM